MYEECSLGIYQDEEAEPEVYGSQAGRVGRYLSWHMRRQLAFGQSANTSTKKSHPLSKDLWWLATALFLLCIIERDRIVDKTSFEYVDVFSICKPVSSLLL